MPKVERARQGVKTSRLKHLLSFLGAGGFLQRYAFGEKLYRAINGEIWRLDAVDRIETVDRIVHEYLETMDHDLGDDDNLPAEADRCAERYGGYGHSRCRRPHHGADTRHKYTRAGAVSGAFVADCVRALTNKDIKSLAGLDNIKTVQGMENFAKMRKLASQLTVLAGKPEDAAAPLVQEVDDPESGLETEGGRMGVAAFAIGAAFLMNSAAADRASSSRWKGVGLYVAITAACVAAIGANVKQKALVPLLLPMFLPALA